MTMHLLQGVTTTRTSSRKIKITKADQARYEEECRLRNKRLRRQGRHDECMALGEYIDYVYGRIKKTPREFKPLNWSPQVRETRHIPSLESTHKGACPAPERKEYTGTLIKGIATMHKSNAVPVINEEQAKDISRMRRG